MSIRDLKAKYGHNAKSSVAVRRAIRAEIPGGSEALDAENTLRHQVRKAREAGESARLNDLEYSLKLLRVILEAMRLEIARRYQLGDFRPE